MFGEIQNHRRDRHARQIRVGEIDDLGEINIKEAGPPAVINGPRSVPGTPSCHTMAQERPDAGTHRSVPQCIPRHIPASLDQVGNDGPGPPAGKVVKQKRPQNRSFTSVQMFHTHTHTHEDADHDFIACAHSMEGLDDSMLWFPSSDVEPELPDEVLRTIDDLANSVEIGRLINMGVLHSLGSSATNILEMDNLTARFVRTFRKKLKDGEPHWLRRSRLVAREYSFFDTREDVYAPASSSICNKLLPAVIMSELCGDTAIRH